MRIARLDVTRFGHFDGFQLDFGVNDGTDFHIVLGQNEAGKSTLVDAWLNILYGIPNRTSYAFRHSRDTLLIGAQVQDGDETLTLTRTPKKDKNLLDASGDPLPQARMDALLRGVSDQAYRALWCLDDKTIEEGGDDILASKGDIGQLLFAAASGLAAFNADLEAERSADRAFQRKGQGRQSTSVYTFSKRLRDLDAQRREIDVDAPKYRRLREEAQAAAAFNETTRDRLRDLEARDKHLRAVLAALPIKAELDTLRADLRVLGDWPDLPTGTVEQVTQMAKVRASHQSTLETRELDLTRLSSELEAVTVSDAEAALPEQLAQIASLRGRATEAGEDLPRRHEEAAVHRAAISRYWKDIGLDSVTNADSLHLPGAMLEALDRAVQTNTLAEADLLRATQEAERAKTISDRAEAALSEAAIPDPEPLRVLLADHGADGLVSSFEHATNIARTAAAAAQSDLDRLSVGTAVFDKVPEVSLTAQGAESLDQQIRALTAQSEALSTRLSEGRESIATLAARLDALGAQGGDVSDAAADAARAQRDLMWQTHRDVLSEKSADSFAAAMADDDRLSSLRLADAARVSEMRQASVQLAEDRAIHATREGEAAKCAAALESEKAQLDGHLSALDLPVSMSAGALAEWLRSHATAASSARLAEKADAELQGAVAKAQPLSHALAQALSLSADLDLAALVQAARALITELDAQAKTHAAQVDTARQAKEDHADRLAALKSSEDAQDSASAGLATALAVLPIRLPEDLDPRDALPTLRALSAEMVALVALTGRIEKMAQNEAAFAEEIARVAAPWPELAEQAPLAQARGLDRIAAQATRNMDRRTGLETQISEVQGDIGQARSAVVAIDAKASDMARIFAPMPDGFDAIHVSVNQAAKAAALRDQIETVSQRLAALVGADSLDAAERMLFDATAVQLQTELDLLAPELKAAHEARDQAIADQALADRTLAESGIDGAVAQLAQERQIVLEDLTATAEAGLTRRIALMLAERALARYRERHQSAMLADTQAAFADLTDGAYPALAAQPTDRGDVLVATRASDGHTLRADETTMSKGTRFQLYLALRLAGYRQMVANGTVLPFLCDDIFETFDEARTAAACRLMHGIGTIGQAIYFTHHAHVAEIAKAQCGDAVKIHRIADGV